MCHCQLFNAKSHLYIYIKYIWCVNTVDNIFKRVWSHFLDKVQRFQEMLFDINNSIYYYSFVCMQLNISKYWCISLKNQLNVSHWFIHSLMINSSIPNNSIQHKPFVCTQLKYQTVISEPKIEPYQVLLLRAKVQLGAVTLAVHSSKLHQIV